jgi:hypothetical protein
MTVLRARTSREEHEYMMLAIGECSGHGVSITTVATFKEGSEWANTYAVDCPRDGKHWEFSFVSDAEPADAPDRVVFGYGREPSRLVDAGQWYVVFSFYVSAVRNAQVRAGDALPDLDSGRAIVDWIDRARAAVEEILKFIPEGADRVPESAGWTDAGRHAYRAAPDQFDRTTLERIVTELDAAIDTYIARYEQAADRG